MSSDGNSSEGNCLGYNSELDLIRIVSFDRDVGVQGSLEMKLQGDILESNSPNEIPSFVKFKEIPYNVVVNAMHVSKSNHSEFFICDNSYYVLMKNNADEQENFSANKPYSDIIEEAGNGDFMGFQPSLSSSTFLLLKSNAIYPI